MSMRKQDPVALAKRCLSVYETDGPHAQMIDWAPALARAVLDLSDTIDELNGWRNRYEHQFDQMREQRDAARAEALALRRDGEYLHRENEQLRGALRNVRALAARALRKGFGEGNAEHLLRFCREVGIEAQILRDDSAALGEEG